jgi:protocatechuate 3,4-dioxygenase beta subunit
MKRIDFLKQAGISLFTLHSFSGCEQNKIEAAPAGTDTTTSTISSTNTSCTSTSSETAGPFPTKSPSSLTMNDIRSDRTGIPLKINIVIQNKNKSCAAVTGALVDIWQCDKDGYYSEYGGTGMQSANFSTVHFLRGRQATDANGLVSFTSLFPGWYPGRAPHIHVHVYDTSGKSLLITQIAFPTDICDHVYTKATAFYTRGTQDTSNARDNVFSDSIANEMCVVTGSIANGYVLAHNIVVSA